MGEEAILADYVPLLLVLEDILPAVKLQGKTVYVEAILKVLTKAAQAQQEIHWES